MNRLVYKTKISKNGIMYYIRVPNIYNNIDYNTYVVVKIILSEDIIIPMVRTIAKLGKYKVVTLPSKMNKIWTVLHGKKVTIELVPVANISTIEKTVKEVLEKLIKL